MQSISVLLQWGIEELSKLYSPEDAYVDACLLLCELLAVDKSYLHTWPDKQLTASVALSYRSAIARRKQGEPHAYIFGHKEFWSMRFKVSEDTLIPRPETEFLVETVLNLLPTSTQSILELGTGTGAIACALASMRPEWQIQAVDVSEKALRIAERNINDHKLNNIQCYRSNWFEQVPLQQFDGIVSNPPYVESDSEYLQTEIRYEPLLALVSGASGLDALTYIIEHAKKYLKPKGLLCFEHGFSQASELHALLRASQYYNIHTVKDYAGLDRITYAYA